jgi:hypothetical protein
MTRNWTEEFVTRFLLRRSRWIERLWVTFWPTKCIQSTSQTSEPLTSKDGGPLKFRFWISQNWEALPSPIAGRSPEFPKVFPRSSLRVQSINATHTYCHLEGLPNPTHLTIFSHPSQSNVHIAFWRNDRHHIGIDQQKPADEICPQISLALKSPIIRHLYPSRVKIPPQDLRRRFPSNFKARISASGSLSGDLADVPTIPCGFQRLIILSSPSYFCFHGWSTDVAIFAP